MTTRAEKRGNKYVINGKKHWITGAGVSQLHLISPGCLMKAASSSV